MSFIPSYSLVEEGSDQLWSEFKQMVRDLGWISPDNSVLWATPQLSTTRCVFARKDEDGSMLGCCVWNEHEDMSWIGYYMTRESVRGAGLGSRIWTRAMERLRATGKPFGLRAVANMFEKYAKGDTRVEISRIRKHMLTVEKMEKFCAVYKSPPDRCIKLYHEMNEDEREDLRAIDRQVTGKDRSEWLGKFFESSESEVAVLFDDSNKVCAYSVVSTIGHREQNLFKMAPCLASSLSEFALLASTLMQWVKKFPPGAQIILGIVSGSVGERLLADKLGAPVDELVTLFSEKIESKMNLDMCFISNNAHCHFDA